jgi:3-deoxy-D-manno-octulosonic-acid transferase
MVRDGQDLYEKITMLLTDNEARRASIDAGRRLVEKQKGAMEKTASLVLETIWKNSPNL